MIERFYTQGNHGAVILVGLAALLLAGFLVTRLTKWAKLPNVTGYILAGIALGPSALGLVPPALINGMDFVSDIALACIAFGTGKFFTKDTLKQTGWRISLLTLAESLPAGLLVALMMRYVFHMDWGFSLLLGAIATATAPASTMMTISQYHAKGDFVNTLLQVVALDDAVCLLAFSLAAAAVSAGAGLKDILFPLLYNALALMLGAGAGLLLARLLAPATRSQDNRLILTIALLLALAGACTLVDISPLLSCMVFGAVYRNRSGDKALFKELGAFTPPVMSLFFILSGMNLDLSYLGQVGIIGLAYFLLRILGKLGGAYLGCRSLGFPDKIQNNLGLALIPQAGVALGLAFLGRRILPSAMGDLLFAIILASSVLYELIGPMCAKIALLRSGDVPSDVQIASRREKSTAQICKNEAPSASQPVSGASTGNR